MDFDDFPDESVYTLNKQIDDTTFILKFHYFKKFPKINRDTTYYHYEIYKTFSDNKYQYKLGLLKTDTLFYYKSPMNNLEDKIFILGKYYYLSIAGELSTKQKIFFVENIDSLIKVRGDDLPPLPEAAIKGKY
jgi:hypothetical protein